MSKSKKILSLVISCVLLCAVVLPSCAYADSIDYTIVNPYATVDWSTWKTYKANLHTHSTVSDGNVPLADMINLYYKADYDILAMTDHGVINYGWNKPRQTNGIFNYFRSVTPLSDADYQRITTGSDRDGRGMTDVTGGIEINMATVTKPHVNGYFTTWGQGVWGTENDYETAPREIEENGGYSVLNHIGDWIKSAAVDPSRASSPNYIGYFANIFNKYHTCLGMEISNARDSVTKYDKVMWDNLLEVVLPTGRNIWAFSDDDSHEVKDVGDSFELFVLPSNTEANVKTAMVNGTFFASSRFARNDISDDFAGDGNVPRVTSIKVDEANDTISVEWDKNIPTDSIEWVAGVESNGIHSKVIASGDTIHLRDHQSELGTYVRFQLKGPGGITYSQAFELQYPGRVTKPIPSSKGPLFDPSNQLYDFYHTHTYAILYYAFLKIRSFVIDHIGK